MAPGHAAYARGLFFASTVLSVGLTPLAVEMINVLFGADVHVNPMAQVVIGSVLLRLGVGLAIGRWLPVARRWIPALQKVSSLGT